MTVLEFHVARLLGIPATKPERDSVNWLLDELKHTDRLRTRVEELEPYQVENADLHAQMGEGRDAEVEALTERAELAEAAIRWLACRISQDYVTSPETWIKKAYAETAKEKTT